MKVVRIFAENVKRLKVVEVVPKKGAAMVVVGGANDQGKSSLLDAIEMALGGKAAQPAEPLRRGTRRGRVVLDLGDLVVTRTFSAGGGSTLKVENKDGRSFASPQEMLNKFYSTLTFDPLRFERQDAKEQAETLRHLVGLDFSALDEARQKLYDERTEENRTVKALQVSADAAERFDGAPEAEVSVEALAEELEAAEGLQRAALRAEEQRKALLASAASYEALAGEQRARIAAFREAMATAEGLLAGLVAKLEALTPGLAQARQEAAAAAEAVPDTAEIRDRLRQAEGVNAQVRTNRQHDHAVAMLEDAKFRVQVLANKIEQIDNEKAERLAAAPYPVPGLAIDPAGQVLLDGLPFEQASTSDRVRVSVAMGLALNPDLRILLVRDGSLIGEAKLKVLEDMVRQADAQLWLEMMQEEPNARTTVFIEDGLVSSKKPPPRPQLLAFGSSAEVK